VDHVDAGHPADAVACRHRSNRFDVQPSNGPEPGSPVAATWRRNQGVTSLTSSMVALYGVRKRFDNMMFSTT
jgi:hypothetical protein